MEKSNPTPTDSSGDAATVSASTSASHSGSHAKRLARRGQWIRTLPYFLSSLFFLSAFFMVFAPLPLLLFHLKRGGRLMALAVLSNCILVGLLGGAASLVFYLVWVIVPALMLPVLFKRKRPIEVAVPATLAAMAALGGAIALGYAKFRNLNLVAEVSDQVTGFVDFIGQSVSVNSGVFSPGDLLEWKRALLVEFPSALAIFSLVMLWANLVLLLRSNVTGVRQMLGLEANYLKTWKAPVALVWVVIASGFAVVFGVGLVSDVGLNFFKFAMAIYAIQGLSILSYFFDFWGIRGFFRFLGFSMSLFLMLPLVLSLGFFDLWFDFRSKLKQA